MNVSVSVVCCKSKILSNGECPLMLQISKKRNRKYRSLGVSINPVFWDWTTKINQEVAFVRSKEDKCQNKTGGY